MAVSLGRIVSSGSTDTIPKMGVAIVVRRGEGYASYRCARAEAVTGKEREYRGSAELNSGQ